MTYISIYLCCNYNCGYILWLIS